MECFTRLLNLETHQAKSIQDIFVNFALTQQELSNILLIMKSNIQVKDHTNVQFARRHFRQKVA